MPDRDYYIAARLLRYQHDRVKTLAEANGLKIGEWVRLSVLHRLSGEDEASLSLVRQCFAIRILLLNILLYLGPSEPGLKPERLSEICLATDQLSDKHRQRVLLSNLPSIEVVAGSAAAARHYQVGARLTESQYQEVARAAEASRVTAAEWLRNTLMTQLSREELLHILTQQVLGVRLILDVAARLLTSGSMKLDHGSLADLTKQTDPTLIQVRPMATGSGPSPIWGLDG